MGPINCGTRSRFSDRGAGPFLLADLSRGRNEFACYGNRIAFLARELLGKS